jgi:hypothetical protein
MDLLSDDQWIGLLGLVVLVAALLFPQRDYRRPQDLAPRPQPPAERPPDQLHPDA